MPSICDARMLDVCIFLSILLVGAWAAPCSGPECFRDPYQPSQHDDFWFNVISFLRSVLSNDNTVPRGDLGRSLETIPEKKWRSYNRFVRIGRSSGSEYLPSTDKRNYVRIGKIPSSAFIRFQGGSLSGATGATDRRLNKDGVVRVG